MRRKGELSPAVIDLDWPHQVAVKREVAEALGYVPSRGPYSSLCPRKRSIADASGGYEIYCFADRQQADRFRDFTGGEDFHPGDRWAGKWIRGRGAARETKRGGWER